MQFVILSAAKDLKEENLIKISQVNSKYCFLETEGLFFMARAIPPSLVVLVTLRYTVGYPLCRVY